MPHSASRKSFKDSPRFQVEPPARLRVADHVFETLARAILNGDLRPGEPLATQRDLAQQFNISALVVRQAIHRLEDLGLVRVKQGSTTIVLDPNESSDIRLIQLRMELAEPGVGLSTAAIENQALFVVPMLVLAERRMTEAKIAEMEQLVAALPEKATAEQARAFRIAYWANVSQATNNPLFQQQVRWWSTLVSELDRRGRDMRVPSGPLRIGMYQALNAAFRARKNAVIVYLEQIQPLLQWMDEEHAAAQQSGAKP